MRTDAQNISIDLGLAVLCAVTPRDRTLTQKDISEVCECSRTYIFEIEKQAINKMKTLGDKINVRAFLQ